MKSEGLLGSMLYYDGQLNDSRMDLAIAMTATVMTGASCLVVQSDAGGWLHRWMGTSYCSEPCYSRTCEEECSRAL